MESTFEVSLCGRCNRRPKRLSRGWITASEIYSERISMMRIFAYLKQHWNFTGKRSNYFPKTIEVYNNHYLKQRKGKNRMETSK